MTPEDLAKLASAVADELERRAKAREPAPFDPGPRGPTTTELAIGSLRMSREVMAPMLEAVPDSLLREVARDRAASAPAHVTVKPQPVADPEPKQIDRSGWRNPRPLKSGLQQ